MDKAQNDNFIEINLPFIDGVEWQSAMLKLRSEKLLRDSIEGFVITAPSDMDALKALYETVLKTNSDESYSSFRVKAHSMKTCVATIGAYHVAGLAKYLEYAARDKDSSIITGIMPLFEREWNVLRKSIISELELDKKDDNLTPISKDDLFAIFDKLESAMSEYDIDGADLAIEELATHSYSDNEEELFNQVKLHVTNLNTDDCIAILTQWRKLY